MRASFRSVEGVTVGSDVRLAGVKVGTVTDLALNPVTFFADAKIALNEGVVLPADSAMLVASEGLLGGAFVEVMPGGSLDNLAPGAEIEDTQGAVSLINLLLKFVSGGSAAPATAERRHDPRSVCPCPCVAAFPVPRRRTRSLRRPARCCVRSTAFRA